MGIPSPSPEVRPWEVTPDEIGVLLRRPHPGISRTSWLHPTGLRA